MGKRNYGVDLLRIFSMLFVVILHIIRYCGLETTSATGGIDAYGIYLLKTGAICAVNCFAIITGFVMCDTKPRIAKVLQLWAHVVFYTIVCTILFSLLFSKTVGRKEIINAVLPVSRKQYWFITAYMGMYLLMPFLNIAIQNMEKRTYTGLLAIFFAAFTVLPTALDSELFGLAGGYTTFWLCLMYLLGGYLKRFNPLEKMSSGMMLLCYGACVGITFLSKYAIACVSTTLPIPTGVLCQYVSPTVVLSAVFLVGGFAKLPVKGWPKKVVAFFAPAALGVYLIQSNPYISEQLWSFLAPYILGQAVLLKPIIVVLVAVMVVLACLCIDRLRICLFRIVRIPAMCQMADEWANRCWNKVIKE